MVPQQRKNKRKREKERQWGKKERVKNGTIVQKEKE